MELSLPDPDTVDIDGPVVYRSWEGPEDTTFVMVHGLGGSQLNWMQVAPALAGLGRVLAPDLPGFGLTPRDARGSGMMDLRRTLGGFVAKLATGRVILCGNSMGGAVAVLQAAVEPDTVEGLVLTGSVYPWVRGGFPSPAVMAAFILYRTPTLGERFVAARARTVPPEQAVRLGFHYVTADPRTIPTEVFDHHVGLMRERQRDPDNVPSVLDAARSMLRLGAHPDAARRALDNVRCPVLVLHGRRDRLVPAAFAESELRRHPAWRGRIFPGSGHAPQMEAPGRWVSEVADWYADTWPRTRGDL